MTPQSMKTLLSNDGLEIKNTISEEDGRLRRQTLPVSQSSLSLHTQGGTWATKHEEIE